MSNDTLTSQSSFQDLFSFFASTPPPTPSIINTNAIIDQLINFNQQLLNNNNRLTDQINNMNSRFDYVMNMISQMNDAFLHTQSFIQSIAICVDTMVDNNRHQTAANAQEESPPILPQTSSINQSSQILNVNETRQQQMSNNNSSYDIMNNNHGPLSLPTINITAKSEPFTLTEKVPDVEEFLQQNPITYSDEEGVVQEEDNENFIAKKKAKRSKNGTTSTAATVKSKFHIPCLNISSSSEDEEQENNSKKKNDNQQQNEASLLSGSFSDEEIKRNNSKKSKKNVILSSSDDESEDNITNKKRIRIEIGTSSEEKEVSTFQNVTLPEEPVQQKTVEGGKRIKVKEEEEEDREILTIDSSSSEDKDDDVIMDNTDTNQIRKLNSAKKKLRPIIGHNQLKKETQNAIQAELERVKRLKALHLNRNHLGSTTNRQRKTSNKQFILNNEEIMSSTDLVVFDNIYLDVSKVKDGGQSEALLKVDSAFAKVLKPHQIEGLLFMWDSCFESCDMINDIDNNGSGCILAHCMGLGKTLQVISLVHTLLTNEQMTKQKNVLILMPVNVLYQWRHEFEKWCVHCSKKINLYQMPYTSSEIDDTPRLDELKLWSENGGVFFLGYTLYTQLARDETIVNPIKKVNPKFRDYLLNTPDLIVCDEGHILKSPQTHLYKCVMATRTHRRIILTGTPLQNDLFEYYCMMSFVKPNYLGSEREFRNRFANPIRNGQHKDSTDTDVILMKKRAHVLYHNLANCVHRRGPELLANLLKPKYEYVISVRLTQKQIELYNLYLNTNVFAPDATIGEHLFNDLNILQRCCTHPWLLKMYEHKRDRREKQQLQIVDNNENSHSNINDDYNEENDVDEEFDCTVETDEQLKKNNWWHTLVSNEHQFNVAIGSKIIIFERILKMTMEAGDKLVVFSQSLLCLDLIESFLNYWSSIETNENNKWTLGKDYLRLDGSTNVVKRKFDITQFNDVTNRRTRLFLISTKAGGLGISLIGANRAILMDAAWNPVHETQSIHRLYRFGQTRPVFIYRLISQGTMEEKIYQRQVTKQSMAQRVIDQHQLHRHFKQQELAKLYSFEPDQGERFNNQMPEPHDTLLKHLLNSDCRQWIVKFHEHQSLLKNNINETLTEEEKNQAWKEYEIEKLNGIINNSSSNLLDVTTCNYSNSNEQIFFNRYITNETEKSPKRKESITNDICSVNHLLKMQQTISNTNQKDKSSSSPSLPSSLLPSPLPSPLPSSSLLSSEIYISERLLNKIATADSAQQQQQQQTQPKKTNNDVNQQLPSSSTGIDSVSSQKQQKTTPIMKSTKTNFNISTANITNNSTIIKPPVEQKTADNINNKEVNFVNNAFGLKETIHWTSSDSSLVINLTSVEQNYVNQQLPTGTDSISSQKQQQTTTIMKSTIPKENVSCQANTDQKVNKTKINSTIIKPPVEQKSATINNNKEVILASSSTKNTTSSTSSVKSNILPIIDLIAKRNDAFDFSKMLLTQEFPNSIISTDNSINIINNVISNKKQNTSKSTIPSAIKAVSPLPTSQQQQKTSSQLSKTPAPTMASDKLPLPYKWCNNNNQSNPTTSTINQSTNVRCLNKPTTTEAQHSIRQIPSSLPKIIPLEKPQQQVVFRPTYLDNNNPSDHQNLLFDRLNKPDLAAITKKFQEINRYCNNTGVNRNVKNIITKKLFQLKEALEFKVSLSSDDLQYCLNYYNSLKDYSGEAIVETFFKHNINRAEGTVKVLSRQTIHKKFKND